MTPRLVIALCLAFAIASCGVKNDLVTPDGNPVTANSLTNQVGLVEIH